MSLDRLSIWAAEAKVLGMRYGDYVAKYHPPLPPEPPPAVIYKYTKTCPECGQVFGTNRSNRIYCDAPCYLRVKKRRQYRKKKEEI